MAYRTIFLYTLMAGFGIPGALMDKTGLTRGLLFGLIAYLMTMLTGHPLLLFLKVMPEEGFMGAAS